MENIIKDTTPTIQPLTVGPASQFPTREYHNLPAKRVETQIQPKSHGIIENKQLKTNIQNNEEGSKIGKQMTHIPQTPPP